MPARLPRLMKYACQAAQTDEISVRLPRVRKYACQAAQIEEICLSGSMLPKLMKMSDSMSRLRKYASKDHTSYAISCCSVVTC